MEKLCISCNTYKNTNDFGKHLKNKSCINCGENRIPTLDFHHLRDKEFNISEGISAGYSLNKIKSEIEKCEILCANCH